MARAGINYTDVTKAAQAIQERDQNPTVDRVLAHLGSGSKSTIAPLLKQWKTEQGQAIDAVGLPDDILKAVKNIHDRVQQSAKVKIEHVMEESQAQISAIKDSLAVATAHIEKLKQDNEQLNNQLETEKTENVELRDQLEKARISGVRLTADNEALASQLDLIKINITEQKQEIRHARENFEHYQTRTAEDRQLEREQYQISKRQLEERIQAASQQQTRELKRSEQLVIEKQQLNDQVKQLLSELAQASKSLHEQSLNTNDLTQKLNATEKQLETLQQNIQNIDSRCHTLITENNHLQTAKQLLAHEVDQLETVHSETSDKLSILDDENRIILQEKAMLQGQFKQLQDSMKAIRINTR